jgi:tetratricopeptide (TPR) repeat protein
MRSGIRLTCLFLLSLGLGFPPASASAAPKPAKNSAASWIKEGERLYAAGRFHDAAEALIQANKLEPNPRLIYNIAKAYDQAGELMGALNYYQQYVANKEGTDVVLLKRSALAIDRLRGLLRQQEEERANAEAVRRQLVEETRMAEERANAEREAKRKALEENEARTQAELQGAVESYQRRRTIGYIAGGAALVGAVGGTVFGILASQSRARFVEAATVEEKREAEGLTRQRAIIADVGFALGAAGALTALLVYPRGPDPSKAVQVTLGPGSAGVEVRF